MKFATLLLLAIGVMGAGAVKWFVKDTQGSQKYCILFTASDINVKLNIENAENATETISFSINETQTVSGNCQDNYNGKLANRLDVTFFPNSAKPEHATDGQPWRLFLWFTAGDKVTFKLADYVLETAPSALFNSTTQNFTKSSAADLEFQATEKNGFKCSTTGLALSSESTIDLKDTRAIAFALLDEPAFADNQTFEQCLLDTRTSDIVPIVVGACLAGLVVVVLVAYLVGRARAKRQGYASV